MRPNFRTLHFLLMLAVSTTAIAAEQPNIIYVLCDDLGYGDLTCLNPEGKIPTPQFDRVAQEGMIFTDAHSGSAVCTPTRYGVLTGRYAWRSKLQSGVLGGLSPRLIEPNRMTVASLLKAQGYHTACVGKWHLGMDWVVLPGKSVTELNIEPRDQVFNVDYSQPFSNGPLSVGFDQYFGISASLDMVPYTFLKNDRVTVLPTEDRDFALMIERPDGRSRKGPAAPGFEAQQVLPEFTAQAIAYIQERSQATEKSPFFLYLPFASPHTPIYPTAEWLGTSGLNPYADFVRQQDHCLGQLLAALDQTGLAENTLLIVTSDNGCSPQAKYPELLAKGHNPSYHFRGHKADIYEGGHRVPFLVRWPQRVKAGQQSSALLCLTDLFATCADILDADVPANAAEDSVSFLPALLGEAMPAERAVVHHSINGSFAIRQGPWKLALCPGSGGWSVPRPGKDDMSEYPAHQLFDLASDIGERKNLVTEQSDIASRLKSLLEQYVSEGRSTPGAPQTNAVAVDIEKAGIAAHRPLKKPGR
ncbi:sulfatase-like hydrolase/transferase [bacterium]|nr:sulfatase-like hydrolase/transferase [bacterium]